MKNKSKIISVVLSILMVLLTMNVTQVKASASTEQDNLIKYAQQFLGCNYEWGAKGPDKFDSSGFTQYVYKNASGINIGRTIYDQIKVGRAISKDELQPGDLVFPSTSYVQIYIGDGKVIYCKSGDKVVIGSMNQFYTARRILA